MMADTQKPVIIAAKRTAIGKAFGAFGLVEPVDLLIPLIHALISETALDPLKIDDVILGNAAGGGGNIARLAALSAGLDVSTPGLTIDRQCGSGLEAIHMACRMVASGAGSIYLAGGVESVSRAPMRAKRPLTSEDEPQFFTRAQFSPDDIGDPDMGVAAENVARIFGITRERQDQFALQSHMRSAQAQKMGVFDQEIIEIITQSGVVNQDETIRSDTTLEKLSALQPKFDLYGTVTAGNACPLNDGAAMVVVTSLAVAKKLSALHGLLFVDGVTRGVDPNQLGIGPVAATQDLMKRQTGLTSADFSFIEFNEAFASQVLASLDQLDISSDRVNLNGGAIALGHPFGASGAVLITRLFAQNFGVEHTKYGALSLATLGTAGGMGVSGLFKSIRIA